MSNIRPVIVIPMGDPAGIGPEIVVKALENKEIYESCKPLVIGNDSILKYAIKITGAPLEINTINTSEDAIYELGKIDLIHIDNINLESFEFGKISGMCGQASHDYIKHAINIVQNGEADSICTPPINKESLQAGKVPYIDHTAMLSAYTNTEDPMTMFEVRTLKIFFLTRHASLKEAINQITIDLVYDYLVRCDEALRLIGINDPRIAVAGLNPHAGEHGLFGNEEMDVLTPGIQKAKKEQVDVYGPIPADSVFYKALNGKYDAVLSLYHDQGHIAAKMTDFERTVSITNGLPFLRVSVDHGTAYDIAGKNIASSVSMVEAIKAGAKYTPFFKNKYL
ncbi:4-hydroxythreonine-4-phosphate dehydrogenase PdxA [Aquibacillus sp. 3ASR75-11]|uniref:4-hydroxythreonine-4-phosphate dehydrogenase PdxA n=1 Tax=Terrihalobacillus insolitus TaxID=2950438 RepID=A0A9X3WTF8_9BACI|nr:4-hydroxythreonine-4-phosphate dehydrogenase PdxA [Terrihalobacillus insolitus]MDC3423104.1 4-hydroxythreonine-4-phosphate dehydrogenase PdxA [Terrihalobacillus insolitus]